MVFLYSCLKIAISAFIAVWLLHLPHKAGKAVVRKSTKDSENLPTQEHQSIGSIFSLKNVLLDLRKNKVVDCVFACLYKGQSCPLPGSDTSFRRHHAFEFPCHTLEIFQQN